VIGWSDTHVTAATAAAYGVQVADLTEALVIHRYAEGVPTAVGTTSEGEDDDQDHDETPTRPSNACRCACPRRITVAPTILALGPITCGICGEPFTSPFEP
jgi:hypothetical protein